jgi:pyruvate dehydrogenase E2 component (dihydrolipoamide acetyltransferase)
MSTEPINVPRLGLTVTEVTFVSWLVADGSEVATGDPIALVETDKVETELEAPSTGRVQHAAEKGAVYPVGQVIGCIVSD